ncbi:hypothetical protein HHI36_018797 [Cryptolaemus montrouzieri]|uniref:Uncharacterized protein n=1 Tax=Cryptolaemus montrouzieri TaxID=559131 RepID=A0ABD2P0Y9_9CUCU
MEEMEREEKEKDVKPALDNEIYVIPMDHQLFPKIEVSALYYSEKLKVHNLKFFDVATKDVHCCWWDESEGKLASRCEPKPYKCTLLRHDQFFNYNDKKKDVYDSIRPGKTKNDPKVGDLRVLKYAPNIPNTIFCELKFSDDFEGIPNRKSQVQRLGSSSYTRLYKNSLKLSLTEWESLQKLESILPIDSLSHEISTKERKKTKIQCHHFYLLF